MNSTIDFEVAADIDAAVKCLKNGGIILYPTDTVWGIGCDARNSDAIKRIFSIKQRVDSKSMLVLVNDELNLEKIVPDIPQIAWQLMEVAVEPLTIIYDKAVNVAPELIAPDGSLGVRITKELFSKELCKRLGSPLVSTSANISGEKTPVTFKDISQEIKDGVDYIVKYNREDLTVKKSSNIIKVKANGEVKIIR